MPGRATAVTSGASLRTVVVALATKLALDAETEVYVGRRIWGSQRKIDVVITDPATRNRLGVECKYQSTAGTAEEKIPATLTDIASWPLPGIVVFAGTGFSTNMRAYLLSTGKAVPLDDLEVYLRFYFGLPIKA